MQTPTLSLPTVPVRDRCHDNTALGCYKECPRRYFIRHVLGWRGTGLSAPLAFGLSWHSAMDVVWAGINKFTPADLARMGLVAFLQTWEEQGFPAEPDVNEVEKLGARTPGVAHEMLAKYIAARNTVMKKATLLAAEQPFAVPLPGFENEWYIGRLDKVIDLEGQRLVIEHKTTSEYRKEGGFRADYVESWYTDSQIKGYQFGGNLFYDSISQVWVDAALVHKAVHDAFRFIPVAHKMPIIQEWINDTSAWLHRVMADRAAWDRDGKLSPGTFPRNENSCMGKYGPCSYTNICRTVSDPSQLDGPPEGYQVEFWQPFELLGLDKFINKE